jgi:hypothetical protein
MGKFTGYEKTGFNTTGNNQSSISNYNSGKSIYAVGLGRTRNTIGSITRKFNYCNLTAPDLNFAFRCTFDYPRISLVRQEVIPDVIPKEDNYITIVCQNGNIIGSSDSGENFTPKLITPLNSSLFQVSMSDTGRYQLVSQGYDPDFNNSLFISNDFGETFGQAIFVDTILTNLEIISITVSGTGRYQLAAVYSNDFGQYCLFISKDFGQTFEQSTLIELNRIIGVSMNNLGTVQIALCINTDNYTLLYISTDYGNNWNELNNSTLEQLFSINLSDDGKYITAGVRGPLNSDPTTIYYGTLDNNLNFSGWTLSSIPESSTRAIFNVVSDFYGRRQIAIGGYSWRQRLYKSYVYISDDYGKIWNPANIPDSDKLYWLSCSISKDGLKLVALACDKIKRLRPYDIPDVTGNFYYYYSFDNGKTWSLKQLSSSFPGVGIYIN